MMWNRIQGSLLPINLLRYADRLVEAPCVCNGVRKKCDSSCDHPPNFRKDCVPFCGNTCASRRLSPDFKPCKLEVIQGQNQQETLIAKQLIPDGTLIIEYVGSLMSKSLFEKECQKYEEMRKYFMEHPGDLILEASLSGNESRFAQHSCNPNCDVVIRYGSDHPFPMLMLQANRRICKGDQITYAYNVNGVEGLPKMNCFCGKPGCPDKPKETEILEDELPAE